MAVSLKKINNNLHKLLFCGVSALCFTSLPAYAGNVYLLQLGTSDTREQAEQKWQDLKSKNADLLSSIGQHITAVSMSADDSKVSYRTEAGPINSRDEATKLCTQLQSKGVECDIVETALYTDDAAPSQAAAPAPAAKESAQVTETTSAAPAAEAPPAAQPTQTAPSVNYVAGREPKFLDSNNPVTEVTQPTATTTPQETATASAQPAPVVQTPHDLIVPERAPRLLNEEEVNKPAPAPATEVATAQQETQPTEAPEPATVVANNDDEDESPAASRRPRMFDQKYRKATAVATKASSQQVAGVAPTEDNKPGFFGRLFGSSPSSAHAPEAETTATSSSEIATAPLAPAPLAAPIPVKEVEGNVSVAEAVRVPFADEKAKKPVVTPAPRHQATRQQLNVGGTYWAQINYFADEQQAHNFYETIRSTYPEIADGVRMSVTRPYAYVGKDGHVTLKMGPFGTEQDIEMLCASAAQQGLHCVSIKEGTQQITISSVARPASISPNLPHERILSETAVDKTPQSEGRLFSSPQMVEISQYWVQLGSFDSPDDAWDAWRDIKRRHKKAVNKISADVSQPEASSALHKLFRLRAGPFGNEGQANALCNKLIKAKEDCVVVGEQK